MSTSASNPATQTLQCEGPFEIFKLTPGVFQADEIKRTVMHHRASPEFIRPCNCVPMAPTAENPPAQGQQSSRFVLNDRNQLVGDSSVLVMLSIHRRERRILGDGRQYRRLALILHPDKNRHPDAEAAFKKLTAAFEKLIDPTQQAACRREATRRCTRQNDRGNTGCGDSDKRGQGPGGGEFPRWCREGEYVPEEKTEKGSTPDAGKRKERPMQEFMDDFAQQEAVFKEQVAEEVERLAEKKRAKAEARAAADQERVDRLREDILGGSAGEEATFEAKTASWQRFSSGTARRRSNLASSGAPGEMKRRRAGGTRGGIAAAGACARASNEPGIIGESPQGGGSVGEESRPKECESGDKTMFACMICRRGFKSAEGLARHEARSELHRINVELRRVMSTG